MYITKILYIELNDIPESDREDYFIGQIVYAGDSMGRELILLAKDHSLDLECLDYIEIVE